MGILGNISASVRKRFFDTFSSRSNTTGSLGVATDGSDWTAVGGTIEVNAGAAKATTTPSSGGAGTTYPIATVTMPTQDNVISLDGTNEGSSVALWVQSSSDWWLVDIESQQTTTSNYSQGLAYYYAYAPVITYSPGTQYYAGPTYTATTYYVRYANVSGKYNTFYSSSSNYYRAYSSQTFYSTAYNYTLTNTSYYYTYASGSTTSYSEYLKIRQSVSSVVSIITSALISTSQTIKSLKVFTSGNQITARAYSDTNFVTQVGSDLVYTATGATITTQYGIAVSPSAYNQSAIIGTSVDINRN